jgi:serine/threonine protein phosphatase PrpC
MPREQAKIYNIKGQLVHTFQSVGAPDSSYNRQHDALLVTDSHGLRRSHLNEIFRQLSSGLDRSLDSKTLNDNGTTAAIAYISTNNVIITAHLGDSRVTIFTRNKKTGMVEARQLTEDHSPEREGERLRIEAAGAFVDEDGYLVYGGEGLAVSRAFGDKSLGKAVADIPEISVYNLSDFINDDDEEAYICVDSDGSHDGVSQKERSAAISGFLSKDDVKISHMPELLADIAIKNGSKDNITVALTKLEQRRHKHIVMAVFDGHGDDGYKVSNAASKLLSGILRYRM